MKFLCDNCKAKYQIADDKVAGKTVRMKCRRCGCPIRISSTGAQASELAPEDRSGVQEAEPGWISSTMTMPPGTPVVTETTSAAATVPTWGGGDDSDEDERTILFSQPAPVLAIPPQAPLPGAQAAPPRTAAFPRSSLAAPPILRPSGAAPTLLHHAPHPLVSSAPPATGSSTLRNLPPRPTTSSLAPRPIGATPALTPLTNRSSAVPSPQAAPPLRGDSSRVPVPQPSGVALQGAPRSALTPSSHASAAGPNAGPAAPPTHPSGVPSRGVTVPPSHSAVGTSPPGGPPRPLMTASLAPRPPTAAPPAGAPVPTAPRAPAAAPPVPHTSFPPSSAPRSSTAAPPVHPAASRPPTTPGAAIGLPPAPHAGATLTSAPRVATGVPPAPQANARLTFAPRPPTGAPTAAQGSATLIAAPRPATSAPPAPRPAVPSAALQGRAPSVAAHLHAAPALVPAAPASPSASLARDGGPAIVHWPAPGQQAPARENIGSAGVLAAPVAMGSTPQQGTASRVGPAPLPGFPGPDPRAQPFGPPATTDIEWYVGIAGSPIGPVPASVLQEKAKAGTVDGESLVWRDGLEEWRPLKTFPELLALIPTAKDAVRDPAAPKPTMPPQGAHTPVAAPSHNLVDRRGVEALGGPTVPLAPALPGTPASPHGLDVSADVRASTPTPAAPATLSRAPASAPSPAPPPTATTLSASVPSAAVAVASTEPSGPEAAPDSVPSDRRPSRSVPADKLNVELDSDFDRDLVPRRRHAAHPLAYAFIASAMAFGGVAAYVLFNRPPPQIVVIQQGVQPSATVAPAVAEGDKGQVDVGPVSTGAATAAAVKPASGTGAPRVKSSATPVGAPIDTSGFTNTVPGPAATPQAATGTNASASPLSQGEISGVVSSNQPMVKRKCWQPALEGRAPNASTNARVNGSLVIAPSGNVDTATASGSEKDFPSLAGCIANRMKGWKFPPSSGPTTVNVPFVFASQ